MDQIRPIHCWEQEVNMKKENDALRGPITLGLSLSLLFAVLALFWMDGNFWCGVIMFALLGFVIAVVIVIQWTTFRMTMSISERLKKLEI
jgi:hypothetical protein